MKLLKRVKEFITVTPLRTLISTFLIAFLIPVTLLAANQRLELRKKAAEPLVCYKTTVDGVNKNTALRVNNLSAKEQSFITFAFFNNSGEYLFFLGDWTQPQGQVLIRTDILTDLSAGYQGYVSVESHNRINYPGTTTPTDHGPCIEVIKGTPFCPLTTTPEQFKYAPTLASVFSRLMDFWQPSGDWRGDSMHDATSFAPFILYNVGKDCENQEYIDRANTTVEWEVQLIDKVLEQIKKDPKNWEEIKKRLYPAVMGNIALIDGIENYSGSVVSKNKLTVYSQGSILLANLALIFGDPQELDEIIPAFNRIQAFSFTADADFQLARITQNPIWAYLGVYLTDEAINQFWVNNQYGGYFTLDPALNRPPRAWDQGSMLMGLGGAYSVSGKSAYLNKKRDVVETTLTYLWDSERGGFIDSANIWSGKNLSSNLALLKGLIRWEELDSSFNHSSEIQRTFEFLENDLLFDNLFYHHWDRTSGRANWFCTGCNFFALDDIYEFNRPIQNPSGIFDDVVYQDFRAVISDPTVVAQLQSPLQRFAEFFTPQFLEDVLSLLLPSPTPTPTPTLTPTPVPTATPTPTITPTPTPTPLPTPVPTEPTLFLEPKSGEIGDTFEVEVMIDTGGKEITGADTILNYEPDKLEGQEIIVGEFSSYLFRQIDEGAGKIKISAIVSPGSSFTGTKKLATIRFRKLQDQGTTSLTFEFTPGSTRDCNLVEKGTVRDILQTVINGSYNL